MTSATIATELGDIEIDLFDESAPKASANFIKLAGDGFYDDVVFHRVYGATGLKNLVRSLQDGQG